MTGSAVPVVQFADADGAFARKPWLRGEVDTKVVRAVRNAVTPFARGGGRMKRWIGLAAGIAMVAACADQAPTSTERGGPSLSAQGPVTVFNTQLRSELEVPTSTSESKGHAQVKVFEDGTIESKVIINNKGGETVRFGHIHRLSPGALTGPIIWWLTTPVGTNLGLTDRHIDIRQQALFVPSTSNPFSSHDEALAELLANPSDFYVNFHSNAFPGGFARGFLP